MKIIVPDYHDARISGCAYIAGDQVLVTAGQFKGMRGWLQGFTRPHGWARIKPIRPSKTMRRMMVGETAIVEPEVLDILKEAQ